MMGTLFLRIVRKFGSKPREGKRAPGKVQVQHEQLKGEKNRTDKFFSMTNNEKIIQVVHLKQVLQTGYFA